MNRLNKNDKVLILTGKDKGKQGEIIDICFKSSRVKVKDTNLMVCHVKPKKQGETGGIVKREAFIHMSNVMPIDSLIGKPVRLKKFKRKS